MANKILCIFLLLFIVPFAYASGLSFDDIEADVEGDIDDGVNAAGGSFDAAPTDYIEITVNVLNDYPSTTENHLIKHVDVEMEVENFCSDDLDQDIDEKVRISDLDPSEDEDTIFRFHVPDCANEGNYDLDITVTGDDEDGTEYSIQESINVNIEKGASELLMDSILTSPMTCENRKIGVRVETHNIGSVDQDAGLLIINDDLGINRFEFMDLRTGKWTDEDTAFNNSFTFEIPEEIAPGDYTLRVQADYADYDKNIKQYLTVVVPDCEETTTSTDSDDDYESQETPADTKTITTTTVVPDASAQQPPPSTQSSKEQGMFSIPLLIGALIAGMIILTVMIVLLKKQN